MPLSYQYSESSLRGNPRPDTRCRAANEPKCAFHRNRRTGENVAHSSCFNNNETFCKVSKFVWTPPPDHTPKRAPSEERTEWTERVWRKHWESNEGEIPVDEDEDMGEEKEEENGGRDGGK